MDFLEMAQQEQSEESLSPKSKSPRPSTRTSFGSTSSLNTENKASIGSSKPKARTRSSKGNSAAAKGKDSKTKKSQGSGKKLSTSSKASTSSSSLVGEKNKGRNEMKEKQDDSFNKEVKLKAIRQLASQQPSLAAPLAKELVKNAFNKVSSACLLPFTSLADLSWSGFQIPSWSHCSHMFFMLISFTLFLYTRIILPLILCHLFVFLCFFCFVNSSVWFIPSDPQGPLPSRRANSWTSPVHRAFKAYGFLPFAHRKTNSISPSSSCHVPTQSCTQARISSTSSECRMGSNPATSLKTCAKSGFSARNPSLESSYSIALSQCDPLYVQSRPNLNSTVTPSASSREQSSSNLSESPPTSLTEEEPCNQKNILSSSREFRHFVRLESDSTALDDENDDVFYPNGISLQDDIPVHGYDPQYDHDSVSSLSSATSFTVTGHDQGEGLFSDSNIEISDESLLKSLEKESSSGETVILRRPASLDRASFIMSLLPIVEVP